MKKIVVGVIGILFITSFAQAQNKKELIFKVEELEKELGDTQTALSESKRETARYKAEMESVTAQMEELKVTNASLLQNMNNFTALSNQKTDNISKSLETLRSKEKQLKTINDVLTQTDSVTLALLTHFKDSLGPSAKSGISNGAVTIVLENTFLFEEVDKNYTVVPAALPLLKEIASVLSQNPQLKILVETNSNALEFEGMPFKDNWDLSALQAAGVVRVLTENFGIAPERLLAVGKSEFGFQGIETTTRIKVQPPYDNFYRTVKDMMK